MLKLNTIYHGDNLDWLKEIPENSIDLVYIDPPFGTQSLRISKTWNKRVQRGVFYDTFSGGVYGYLDFIGERLAQIHRVLRDTGSLFLHLDYRMAHYAKIELDKIFGIKNFNNEIIWCYSTSGRAARGKRNRWAQKHDTILWYAKNRNNLIADCTTACSEEYIASHYKQKDKDGNVCRIRIDHGKSRTYYPSEGINGNDWWSEISPVNSMADVRADYPTQKPVELLEKIIKSALPDPKDKVVLDCFCGCGTTLIAAQNLGASWIGVDASLVACREMEKRLKKESKVIVKVEKRSLSRSQYLKLSAFEFEKAVVRAIGGVANTVQVGDNGVDGMLAIDNTPIQVKKSESVGRPVLDSFYKHISKHSGKRGIIIALSFGKGIQEEKIKLERENGFDIQLLTLDDVIKEKFREDKRLL